MIMVIDFYRIHDKINYKIESNEFLHFHQQIMKCSLVLAPLATRSV